MLIQQTTKPKYKAKEIADVEAKTPMAEFITTEHEGVRRMHSKVKPLKKGPRAAAAHRHAPSALSNTYTELSRRCSVRVQFPHLVDNL
jgi:hypothetical protein